MNKKIVVIWAEDKNHLIGKDQHLPWRLPKELKHFKETTMGNVLLMGRVTFDGMNRRVLPGRETIVLTRDQSYSSDGVMVFHTVEDVLDWFGKQDKSLFIVGGASIYRQFLPYAQSLIKTEVNGVFKGDTYFPNWETDDFELTSKRNYLHDEQNAYDFTIKYFVRKVE